MSKIAFLFPGQGAQSVGMCKELDQELPAVRALFDRAGEILGFDLRQVCFEGPAEALEATDVSQPAIFVASLAALESLKVSDPSIVENCAGAAGLSLGEYTALVFAGAIDFAAGLEVVRRRGQAMQAASLAAPSGMTSVLGLDEAKVDELCRRAAEHGRLWKANMLGPGNIAVSGEAAALEATEPIATELGAMKVVRLAVAGAFHTPLMKPADQASGRGPRANRHPASSHPGLLERRAPSRIWKNRWPFCRPSPSRSLVASGGKNRCGGCWPTALTRFMRSAPAES